MPIISVRDNESNRWKRKTKNKDRKEQMCDRRYSESNRWKRKTKNKDRKEQRCDRRYSEVWELNDFVKIGVTFIYYFLKKRIMQVKACCGGV